MKRKYTHTGLYAYLDAHGADTATPEQLAELRKEYWREYKRKWKADKRNSGYTVTLYFSGREISLLNHNAKKYSLSRPKYIKHVALKRFPAPDLGPIRSLFTQNYNALLELCRDTIPADAGAELLYRMELIELAVISHLQNYEDDAG